ncbi:MAG TPA: putative LPS assembly protein LptD [Gemmatimonadaceae bacterium]|nr:putative LPS assembly protein LptD [Gemmatimonadaceae bacterium]
MTRWLRAPVRHARSVIAVAFVAAVAFATPSEADTQVPRDTTTRRDTTARRDTTFRRDTLPRDTTRAPGDTIPADSTAKFQVEWATPDSVMAALLEREGYVATKYQGDQVQLRAQDRVIRLIGDAAVGRPEAVLVGDTVTYNDSLDIVTAVAGDTGTVILQDPTGGQDDIVARRIVYEVENRRGLAYEVTTAVESGQRWVVHGEITGFLNDSSAARRNAFYAKEGWITSCQETKPHYHFASKEMKVISKDVMVARPAILYIGDIPVFWLPFVFQDLRSGRRSGIIPPRFGVSDIVRNSPDYRRTIEDLGYYFALSDYYDAQVALDWRSSAGAEENDPGWIRYKGSFNYRWLNRFLSGGIDVSYLKQGDGLENRTYSWNHEQQFSQRSRLSMSLNYASSTTIQRRNTFNPWNVLSTIDSRLNYQQQIGAFQLGLGGSRKQYPGREQVDQDFPSINVSSKPINLGTWLTWTPSLQFGNRQSLHIDNTGRPAFRYIPAQSGVGIDSVLVDQSTRVTSASFDTPIKIGEFTWTNSFRYSDNLNDFPLTKTVLDPADSSRKQVVTFERDFTTTVDWTTGINLPSFFQGTWKLSPSVSFQNVDPKPFFFRSQFSSGKFAQQKKRVVWSLSSSPTFFGLFPGLGPVERFRHSISPSISYSYAPRSSVSDDYLRATNQTRQGYLGSLAQNLVSLTLSTNIEAKMRTAGDSVPDEAKPKVKLLSVNFTSLEYDFQRAKETGGSGFVTDRFGYTIRSDLLPGFDFGVDYSLFRGSPRTSDTAEFSPYREAVRGSLSLNRQSGIVAAVARLFGMDLREPETPPPAAAATRDTAEVRSVAAQRIAGSVNTATRMNEQFGMSGGGAWQVDLTYSSQRSRPIEGAIVVDPEEQCGYLQNVDPLAFEQCVQRYTTGPGIDDPFAPTTGGGQVFRSPPTRNIQASTRFGITPKWAMQWSTNYDFVRGEFGMHTVSLRRELHDWDAIFAFTQSPNGNFAFNFFIALRAQPELKFNYDRRSYRRTPGGFQ